jgi:uncharacterized protein (DUF1697 family)
MDIETANRRIILMRAVNVGGAKLPMAEFREILEGLGATNVRTYIASGNAVVDVPSSGGAAGGADAAAAFDRAVERAVTDRYGYVREAISRTPAEVEAALAAHPFDEIEARFSYLMFLAGEPTASALEKAQSYPTGDDLWAVIGREQHIRFVEGAGRPQMKSDAILKSLGVVGTARNLNTVRALIALARE